MNRRECIKRATAVAVASLGGVKAFATTPKPRIVAFTLHNFDGAMGLVWTVEAPSGRKERHVRLIDLEQEPLPIRVSSNKGTLFSDQISPSFQGPAFRELIVKDLRFTCVGTDILIQKKG